MLTYGPLYRLHNGTDHFYTTSEAERDAAEKHGYKYEGIACYVSPNFEGSVTPLHRLYNGADHFYTTSEAERDAVEKHGYKYEGIACYVSPSPEGGVTPLHRLYNGADHFYTASEAERDAAEKHGYKYEKIACYVIGAPLKLSYIFDRLDYDTPKLPPSTPDLIGTQIIQNNSKQSELTQEVTFTQERSTTFEWGLTQQLSVGITMGVEVGVPDIASVTQQISVQVDLGAHQTWTTSQTITYSVGTSVVVPPDESVEVSGYVDFADDITVPFKLYIRLSGSALEQNLSQDQLTALFLLENPGFPQENIWKSSLPNELILMFEGVFSGSYGINTSTEVKALSKV